MYIYIIILFITLGSMVCELCNITTLHITFIPNLFCKYGKNLLPLQDKRKQQPKHTSPLIYNIMIIKHLQGGGLPTSASSVNAMCGACRHSCNPFRNDHLPFFLRHRKARRRNQGAQQSRRQSAIIASCKAIIRRNAIETSRSCVLTDIMWRSAL